MTWKKSMSGRAVLWLSTFFVGLCVTGVSGGGEPPLKPAILVSSYYTWEILRYDGVTGEFVGVHVPRGRMLAVTGLAVADNDLYVACGTTDEILRFNLQTGEFIDVFIKPRSGGLDRPARLSINTGAGGAFGRAVASARADLHSEPVAKMEASSLGHLATMLAPPQRPECRKSGRFGTPGLLSGQLILRRTKFF